MAGTSPTAAAAPQYFNPTGQLSGAQQQAINQAISSGIQSIGSEGQYNTAGTTIQSQLANSGLFDPTELGAINTAISPWLGNMGDMQNAKGGNTGGFTSYLQNQINQNLNPVLSSEENATTLSTPSISPNSPAMQALAGGYNPLQPNYLGAPPTLAGTYGTASSYNPTTYNAATGNAATYGPTTYNASMIGQGLINQLSPAQTMSLLNQSVAPQEQQQNQQLMQMLAASGIAPGSTAGQTAYNNLAQQQLAGISPALASALQGAQGNILSAANTNVGALNTAGQYNAGSTQSANAGNAAAINNILSQNLNALNTAGQYNAGAYNTGGQYNATNAQNMGLYNAGVANTVSQQNLQNLLNTNLYNTGAANTAGTNWLNALTGAQNVNQGEIAGLLSSGLSGNSNLASGVLSGGNAMGQSIAGTFPVMNFNAPTSYSIPPSTNTTQSLTTPSEINATNPQNYSTYGSLPYGQNAGDAGGG